MDFHKLKTTNWNQLQKTELGLNYGDTFGQIHNILKNLGDFLLLFEASYSNFIAIDKQEISDLYKNLLILIEQTMSFEIIKQETTTVGVARANNLLHQVTVFYNDARRKLSEFQVYLRKQGQKETDDQVKIVNEKISEFARKSETQQNQVSNFINNAQTQLSTNLQELQNKIVILQETITKAEKVKNNVEEVRESVQNFSLNKITTEYGNIFNVQATKNLTSAKFFGFAFLFWVFIAFFLICYWFLPLVDELKSIKNIVDLKYYYIITAFVVRLTTFFFVFWIAKECLRNYNSNAHLYNLNRHRFNSLKSFEIVVKNNIVPENRDDLVKQIAQTIFNHQEDGLLPQEKSAISLTEIASIVNALKK
ncbi:MAG: hypothetical protein WC688_07375 [Parachlamydiales bacterium]|jgi:hypothetical protein